MKEVSSWSQKSTPSCAGPILRLLVAPLLSNPEDRESAKFTDEEKAIILEKQFASVFTHMSRQEVYQYSHHEQIHAYPT